MVTTGTMEKTDVLSSPIDQMVRRMSLKESYPNGFVDYDVDLNAVEKERRVSTDEQGNPIAEETVIIQVNLASYNQVNACIGIDNTNIINIHIGT